MVMVPSLRSVMNDMLRNENAWGNNEKATTVLVAAAAATLYSLLDSKSIHARTHRSAGGSCDNPMSS